MEIPKDEFHVSETHNPIEEVNQFWDEFLRDSRSFENCTVRCRDGVYRTHKVLLYNSKFLASLLSQDDPGDESMLLLPDFCLEQVITALDFNVKQANDLSTLLDNCFKSLAKNEPIDPLSTEGPVVESTGDLKEEPTVNQTTNQTSEIYLKYLTTDGRFECDACNKVFKSFRFLTKHKRILHEVDSEEAGSPIDDKNGQQTKAERPGRGRKRRNSEMEDFIVEDHQQEDATDEEVDSELEGKIDEEETEAKPRVRRKKKTTQYKTKPPKGGDISCSHCDKGFSTQKYLDSHMTNKHPEKSEINSFIEEKNGVHSCLLCQKTFTIARRCRYHLKFKHKIGAKFSCDQCKKKFYYEYDLELHKRFHGTKRNFVCDLCGKGFLIEAVLQAHKHNMHSTREEKEKGRKFVCSFCAKGFFSKSALQEHEFLHSEKKNFHCALCGLSFKQSSGLRAHNGRHHNETGPKPITEEHKLKMRNYMKKYRAMKAGKLPNNINQCFRSKTEEAASSTEPTTIITLHPSAFKADQATTFKVDQAASFKLEGQREYATRTFYV